ncbi:hypothetical protein B9Z51_07160 [Limnohabitans sp. T6-5]|uniref:hypothetical protein n=1 Tax=Limnohabitans sp. T6-5 TaxID=1100724 RepID=UPI000D3672FB|nr:hypothetical protein [Limnohabitans sp. T6-5]PUE08718.1 hypothetical protein B9Z51_07160 [Limnohabitans sp. T6-5]
MSKRLSANDMRQALKAQMDQQEQLKTSTGTGNPMPTSKPGDFDGRAIIRLKVRDVGTYERNPRTRPNEKREEIKESILARGLDQNLAVTKRPGSDRYILAKGGNTRLSILWELAEKYPDRFTSLDFDLVNFKAESHLLVGHMSENLNRSDMCFWDTANSYLELRKIRSQELGRDISLKDFAAELKQQGLTVENSALGDFEFVIEKLTPLGVAAKALGRNDVLRCLRPQFKNLGDIRVKLFDGQKSSNEFASAYADWLKAFGHAHEALEAGTGTSDAENDRPPTSLARELEAHLATMAAAWFGLTEAELSACMQAIAADRTITAAQLQNNLEQLRTSETASTVNTTAGNQGDESGAADTDSLGAGTDSDQADFVGGGQANSGDYDTSSHAAADEQDDVADSEYAVPTGRVPSALNGVKTAPEHLLTNIPNPGAVDGQNNTGAAPFEGGADPTGEQGQLPGTTSLEMAVENMRSCIMDLTDYASLTPLLRNAPGMPLGYFMDAPASSLGVSATDFAAQAWWLLATMSGQLTVDWFHHQVTNEQGVSGFALFDTGPAGFRARAEDQDGWMQFVQTHLGGTYQADGYYTLELLTDLSNPVGEYARELVKAVGTFRLLSQQEQQ